MRRIDQVNSFCLVKTSYLIYILQFIEHSLKFILHLGLISFDQFTKNYRYIDDACKKDVLTYLILHKYMVEFCII